MWDITSELNNIIVRYSIDSGFPGFGQYCKAVELIRSYFSGFAKDDRVLLVASCQTDLKYIRSHYSGYAVC